MNPKLAREVLKTTFKLLHQLAAVLKIPKVCMSADNPTVSIELYEKIKKAETREVRGNHTRISIAEFLSLDVPTAIAAGGSLHDLLTAKKKERRLAP